MAFQKPTRNVKLNVPVVSFSKKEKHISLRQAAAFVLVFGVIGAIVLLRSFATTQPVVATYEMENSTLPVGAQVVSDSAASGGKAVSLTQSTTVNTSVTIPAQATSVAITARATQCSGSPAVSMAIDGASVLPSTTVGSSTYASFSATTNLSAGTHQLSVAGTNIGQTRTKHKTCARTLYLDVVTFYGQQAAAAPTVSLTANSSSVNTGGTPALTWSSNNATSCTASGGWSGTKALAGTETEAAISANTTYSLSCTGSGGTTSTSATVAVNTVTSGGGTSTAPKPDASNTGVPTGTALTTITGDYTVDRGWNNSDPTNDGKTIQNLHVTGDLYLAANNLTVKNVQVDGSIVFNGRPGGNYYATPVTGISVDYCSARYISVNYGYDSYSLNHCHVGSSADTFMAFWPSASGIGRNLTVQNSLFDGLQALPAGSAHVEAIHGFGGQNFKLVNNVIDFRAPDQNTWNQTTAALNLSNQSTPVNDGMVLDNNWIYGGSYYQMYMISSNATVTNNKFFSFTSPDGSKGSSIQYPPSAYDSTSLAPYGGTYPKFTQSGNTLDGNPVSLPGGK